MKNIFSSLGTKKVAGVVLAGATLLVGLGVVNNFSGGNQKAANEAALARLGNSAYNNFSGGSSASRADLERQMSASQEKYTARFLKGKSNGIDADEAFSSDGAYAEGIRGGEGSSYGGSYIANTTEGAYANGDIYQAFDSTYEQSIGGSEEGSYDGYQGSSYGERQFQATQNAVASAAKGVKGKDGKSNPSAKGQAGQVRGATQINKLSASSGGSSSSGGTAGGARGGVSSSYGSSGARGGDSNSQVLPQNNVPSDTSNSQAFKFGRAGNMGGFNVGFNGSESKGGRSRGTGAAGDLQMAAAYSSKALATKQGAGAKSLAEAAFDGSNPEDLAPTIPEGATIGQVASELGSGLNIDMSKGSENSPLDIDSGIKDLAEKAAELAALQKKLTWMMIGTALAALVISILISVLKGMPWVAWIITGLAAIALVIMGVKMFNVIKEMQDPKFKDVNQGISWNEKYASVGLILLLSGGLIAAGWSNMWQKAWKNIEAFFDGATKGGGFSIDAGWQAAKAANKAAEGFKLKHFLGIFSGIKSFISDLFPSK